jgi:SAM-dependent methyltransferase
MVDNDPATRSTHAELDRFQDHVQEVAAFILPSLLRQRNDFGEAWASEVDDLLRTFLATDDETRQATIEGYVEFAIDGMRLQKAFERTGRYEAKTYDQAAEEVYRNKDYMFSKYLPGILMSHYLWPHHYRQLQFFRREFLPRFVAGPVHEFLDVGPGTGFYTRLLLMASPRSSGSAIDISEPALEYCDLHLSAFGVRDRWTPEIRDVIANPPRRKWPFILSVEVLEHLTDPVTFLKALRAVLAPGGFAHISAAITAANRDHIYLYTGTDHVRAHLEEAGFSILACQEDRAYAPKAQEPVPTNAAFLCTVG